MGINVNHTMTEVLTIDFRKRACDLISERGHAIWSLVLHPNPSAMIDPVFHSEKRKREIEESNVKSKTKREVATK